MPLLLQATPAQHAVERDEEDDQRSGGDQVHVLDVAVVVTPHHQHERVFLQCRIFDAENVPVNDAMIELWQAYSDGRYRHADTPASDISFSGFGRAATNEHGFCDFETIKPGPVPSPDGKLQAPHISVAIYARGILLQLYSRIYFAGDPANDQDSVLALVPEARRQTLLAQPDP
ncbi:MAG TPA: protocatechuate 3,4-dioxygenase subunit alpha, partial [Micromonosporaceae bacterium]